MFITFEGGEGSGKSTVIKEIAKRIADSGREVVLTREPGGTPIGEEIRNVILEKKNTAMDPRTEALLYAASRRQHLVEKIIPALKEGKVVISDRFLDSSLAYQGMARGLGMAEVYQLNLFATEGFEPDLTIYLSLDPEAGIERIEANPNREVNRLDLEKISFHELVHKGFEELTKENHHRIVKVDASKSVDQVIEACWEAVEKRLRWR